MSTDKIFFIFAFIIGLASGELVVLVPQSRDIGLAPYFWVLIAFALFEGIAHVRRGGVASGPPINMPTRLIGFAIALALLVLIPWIAGVPLKLI